MRASVSCLRGEPMDGPPRPLYQREGDGEFKDGINMIGKARLVSASPFRATLKLNKGQVNNGQEADSDDEF